MLHCCMLMAGSDQADQSGATQTFYIKALILDTGQGPHGSVTVKIATLTGVIISTPTA